MRAGVAAAAGLEPVGLAAGRDGEDAAAGEQAECAMERSGRDKNWIATGCPESVTAAPEWIDPDGGGPLADPAPHNDFFRDFDNWAMFFATPQTQDDIDAFFAVASAYFAFALDATQESGWITALQTPGVADAVVRLEEQQRNTVTQHYGKPVQLLTLLDGFIRFGDDSLPDDPQRPADPRHNMNGRSMWFFWADFADAYLRLSASQPTPAEFWHGYARAILIGILNDGLFRGRFDIIGFTADAADKQASLQHIRDLDVANIPMELTRRLKESDIFS